MENLPVEQPETVSSRDCANCGQPALEEDHPTLLCGQCRRHFIRYPIPLWIKGVAGAVGLLLLFSLFTFPRTLSLGVGLEKGKKAIKERKFSTAERDLKQVLEKVPGNVEAQGNLLIASFYNQDFGTFSEEVKKLEHVNIEDKELLDRMDGVMGKAGAYVSNDSFENFSHSHPQLPLVADADWNTYFLKNPDDTYAATVYANLLMDRKEYSRCDSVLQSILKRDDEYFPALALEAGVKREEGQLDSAMFCVGRILAVNEESSYGLAAKVRTLLRQKKDKQALDLALKTCRTNDTDLYAFSSLILAYHFNGLISDRDAAIKKAREQAKDSAQRDQLQYSLDVIEKKEKFRD